MANPYYVQPANIMPGLNAAFSGMVAGAEAAQERKATEATQKKLDLFAQEAPNMTPEQYGQFLLKNRDVADHIIKVTGETDKLKIQNAVNSAWDVVANRRKPEEVLMEHADEMIGQGVNAGTTLHLAEDAMRGGDKAFKAATAVLAQHDPKGLEAFYAGTGQGPEDKSSSTDISRFVDWEVEDWKKAHPGEELPAGLRQNAALRIKRQQAEEAGSVAGAKKEAELELIKQMQPGIERDKALASYRATAEETRSQRVINDGLAAAEGIPNIKRGIELLNSVKTGGFGNMALTAKRLFGVEGADEGELSYRLSRKVLAQLKQTFGAQFTAQEANKLERIESNFGKSPANNKRLLTQAMRMLERKANAAKRLAKRNGDQTTIDEINDWMNFSLSLDEKQGQQMQGMAQASPSGQRAPKEGDTATLPGNKKIIWRNGGWEDM